MPSRSRSEGALGALADAGIAPSEVDGVVGQFAQETVLELGLGPCTRRPNMLGIPAVLEAAALITSGECEVVLISAGGARLHRERSHTAPWTRPANELVVGLRPLHGRRVRPHGQTAHDHVRDHAPNSSRRSRRRSATTVTTIPTPSTTGRVRSPPTTSCRREWSQTLSIFSTAR